MSDAIISFSSDQLKTLASVMKARIRVTVASGRIDLAQDARLVLDQAMRELKRRRQIL